MYLPTQDLDAGDPHLRRQVRLIDLSRVDIVGRFERFALDAAMIFDQLGLRFDASTRRNASARHEGFRRFYDDATAERVADLYALDRQVFGYDFDLPG